MSQNVSGTFVSEKVNKVRWMPDPFNDSHSFLTGSWDNLKENTIKLWDFQESEGDTDIYPFVAHSVIATGDVTELAVSNLLVANNVFHQCSGIFSAVLRPGSFPGFFL